jgi:hypothetical protein
MLRILPHLPDEYGAAVEEIRRIILAGLPPGCDLRP